MDFPVPSFPNSDDYSAAATLIPFPRQLPLLRGPISAARSDDPSSGPYLLAFKNPNSWAAAYTSCKAQLILQCESGARIGCSISASSKCKPPWWKFLIGAKQDFRERANCEEIEMEGCLVVAKERCVVFAKEKCRPAFENARIEVKAVDLKGGGRKEVFRLISGVIYANSKSYGLEFGGVDKSWDEFRSSFEVNNVRGRELLSSDELDIEDYIRKCG